MSRPVKRGFLARPVVCVMVLASLGACSGSSDTASTPAASSPDVSAASQSPAPTAETSSPAATTSASSTSSWTERPRIEQIFTDELGAGAQVSSADNAAIRARFESQGIDIMGRPNDKDSSECKAARAAATQAMFSDALGAVYGQAPRSADGMQRTLSVTVLRDGATLSPAIKEAARLCTTTGQTGEKQTVTIGGVESTVRHTVISRTTTGDILTTLDMVIVPDQKYSMSEIVTTTDTKTETHVAELAAQRAPVMEALLAKLRG